MDGNVFSSKEKRAARLRAYVEPNQIIGERAYNLLMGGVVLYGLILNFILCITVGVDIFYSMSPFVILLLYIVMTIAGTMITAKSNNAFISFLGYNLVVLPIGIMVSVAVYAYGGIDSSIVGGAFFYTALITAIMILASILYPQIFSRMGGFLFAALFGVMIAGLVMSFVGIYSNVYSYIVAIIFALYIGYDFYRSQQFAKTADNAVDCALDIYLDIINLFIRILQILGRKNKD